MKKNVNLEKNNHQIAEGHVKISRHYKFFQVALMHTRYKKILKLVTLFAAIVTIQKLNTRKSRQIVSKKKPLILLYTNPWLNFKKEYEKYFCDLPCELSLFDRTVTQLMEADAIIFHPASKDWDPPYKHNYPPDFSFFNKYRTKNQIFTFMQWESPYYHKTSLIEYNRFFNHTMSYRLDSTIQMPYSSLSEVKLYEFKYNNKLQNVDLNDENLDKNFRKPILKKTRGVIVVMSLCRGDYRMDLVKKLDGILKFENGSKALEVYGKCSNKLQNVTVKNLNDKLSIHQRKTKVLLHEVTSDYKFYVSIENSFCKDYVTEKLFQNAIRARTVPIVGGLERKFYEQFLPKSSFIHVDDFRSVSALGDHLNLCLKDDQIYNKYFDWMWEDYNAGDFIGGKLEEFYNLGFCKLCRILHSDIRKKSIIEDLNTWWYGKNKNVCFNKSLHSFYCKNAHSLIIF